MAYINNFFPVPLRCAHCDDPACLVVCENNAISKNNDGIVIIDEEKCVGCGNCSLACPYGMITLDLENKRAIKCDLCVDLTSQGKAPACVENCALKALVLGDLENLEDLSLEKVNQLISPGDLMREIMVFKEG
jgi:carbon-monoxide dehydrogenase iron sulfur subunit